MSIYIPEGLDGIEAHQIHDNLWQGAYPPYGPVLASAGIKLVVLCASEFQPPSRKFPGVKVWHAPNEDVPMPPTRQQLEVAIEAANQVVASVSRGEPALVTCWAGINRSSLVTGLALYRLTGMSGADIVNLIQFQRPGTLTNDQFKECLERLAPRI